MKNILSFKHLKIRRHLLRKVFGGADTRKQEAQRHQIQQET
ncbi:hypothetical protein ACJD0Z_15685 [Flavobacteriaceae bacterium M23B6Z8]